MTIKEVRTLILARLSIAQLLGSIVEPQALIGHAMAAAENLARLAPAAFRITKEQIRQPVAERMQRSGTAVDKVVTDAWEGVLGYVRDYVARTLNKA